jgi:hypothetical protein
MFAPDLLSAVPQRTAFFISTGDINTSDSKTPPLSRKKAGLAVVAQQLTEGISYSSSLLRYPLSAIRSPLLYGSCGTGS